MGRFHEYWGNTKQLDIKSVLKNCFLMNVVRSFATLDKTRIRAETSYVLVQINFSLSNLNHQKPFVHKARIIISIARVYLKKPP